MAPKLKIFYKSLSTSSDSADDDNDYAEDDGLQLNKQLKRKLILSRLLSIVLAICIVCLAFMKSPQGIALISRPEPPLGAEPWGFVPWEVGNPPTWRNFYNDSRDPWWMDEDTFDTKEKFSRAVRRLKWLHNSTTFSAQGGHTRYRDWQGEEHTLRPTVSAHRGVYGIRSFHQIHCIIVITDDYGRRIHGLGSQWTPGHVMHCINVLRQLIQCMADTSLVSFAHSPHGHLGDGQQMWCRRFDDIKEWASEPERGTSLRLVSPPEQLFEVWDEITPYPGREPLPDDWK